MRTISADALKDKITAGDDFVLINVLSEEYFNDCRIVGSINVPLVGLKEKAVIWDKNKTYIVYCASYVCSASSSAHDALVELGFNDVYAYEGGMKEWKARAYPSQGPCASSYLK
jgi:rhodanese-related sulfurtransferase